MRYEKMSFCRPAGLVLVLVWSAGVFAAVRLPAVISDNMVLQQGEKAPIWGWAKPGEIVAVRLAGQMKYAKADASCKWRVRLDEMKAVPGQGGMLMTVGGENTIEVKNVLVGEVWFCSGQSNMQMAMSKTDGCPYGGVIDAEKEIAAAKYPNIRFFTVEQKVADKPMTDCNGVWVQCSPETVKGFSAAAYFFGRELHRELNVPIGLIHSSWGSTTAEAWMSEKALKSDPEFESIFTKFTEDLAKYPDAKKLYDENMKEWESPAAKAEAEGKKPPEKPVEPRGAASKNRPSGLYNGMVAPIMPYAIRGVIWYQGEANRKFAKQYRKLFPALIANWRSDWRQGDFPFYYVQIAPFKYNETTPVAAEVREAQLMSMGVKNVGMAVSADIGDANSIHPKNKQEIGRRLSLWAMAKTYGKKVEYCGPIYKSMKTKGDKIVLDFDYADGGLVCKGEKLKGFTISGKDGKFFDAEAEISGDNVAVWSRSVSGPTAVRYGWENCPVCSLFNKAGLPASPFRTDVQP